DYNTTVDSRNHYGTALGTVQMSGSISIHIRDLREGDGDAAHFIWGRFFPQLKRLAKLKLAGLRDPMADEEDVAVNAFASFCRGVESGRFDQLENRDDIWQVLLMLTVRKAVDQRRYAGRDKRRIDAGSLSAPNEPLVVTREELEGVVCAEPTPDFAVMLAEQFHGLIEQLEQPDLQKIALAKLEGYTDAEIADQLQVARRTVVRKLRLIRSIWESPNDSDSQ
ncbi:MAG: hypothetical protein KDB23_21135, partial [Planctomycetales bacterium]|nr:hypothetical protein [Planctomycetales bacterium]